MTNNKAFLQDECGAAVVDVSVVLAVVIVALVVALVIRGTHILDTIAEFADVLG